MVQHMVSLLQTSAPSLAMAAPQSSFNASASGAAANLAAMDAAIRGSGPSASGVLLQELQCCRTCAACASTSTTCLQTPAPDHSATPAAACCKAQLDPDCTGADIFSAGPKPQPSRPSESQGGLEAERSYSTAAGMTFDGSGIPASAASSSARAPAHSEQSITAGEFCAG